MAVNASVDLKTLAMAPIAQQVASLYRSESQLLRSLFNKNVTEFVIRNQIEISQVLIAAANNKYAITHCGAR